MKRITFACALLCTLFIHSEIYSQRFDQLDKAPVDISYLMSDQKAGPMVKVVYSRPAKEKGKVFGDLVPYGEIWRTGANEATEITFFKDMLFGDKIVKAGKYVMHTIPGEKEWTIILNSNTDTWGAFFYDPEKDVVRIKVPASRDQPIDIFSIAFTHDIKDAYMVLAWDRTRVNIPLEESSALLAKI